MTRICFVFMLAVLATSCISGPIQTYFPEEIRDKAIFDKVSPSIVEIENYRFNSYTGYASLYCTGSGYVWDDENHVITNAHVCQYAASLKVILRSGERRDAKLIGIDYTEDIAVLKVTTFDPIIDKPLIPIDKGNSDKLFVGQAVYSFGYPFGLPLTMCKGIISGLPEEEPERDDIQTDVAINPGNSGGALVDTLGRLIGMPSYIYSRSGSNSGCGFALPINRIKEVVTRLMEEAKDPGKTTNRLFFNQWLWF